MEAVLYLLLKTVYTNKKWVINTRFSNTLYYDKIGEEL